MGPSKTLVEYLAELPAQLNSMETNCTFNLVSLLDEQLHAGLCPAMFQLLSKKTLCSTHTTVLSHNMVLCTYPPHKKQNLSLGHDGLLSVSASDRPTCGKLIVLGD